MDDDISPFIGQKRADILRGVAEFGALALGEIVAHLKKAPLADDILPRQ